MDQKLVPIPFNFKSIDLCFPDQAQMLKAKLLEIYPDRPSVPILELKNHPDPLLQKLSQFIYDNLFLNYTTKM